MQKIEVNPLKSTWFLVVRPDKQLRTALPSLTVERQCENIQDPGRSGLENRLTNRRGQIPQHGFDLLGYTMFIRLAPDHADIGKFNLNLVIRIGRKQPRPESHQMSQILHQTDMRFSYFIACLEDSTLGS